MIDIATSMLAHHQEHAERAANAKGYPDMDAHQDHHDQQADHVEGDICSHFQRSSDGEMPAMGDVVMENWCASG